MATTNLGLETIQPSENVSPDKINSNMERLDRLGVDYVTQSGATGVWLWRRWKSGRFECWARLIRQSLAPTLEGYSEQGYVQVTENFPVTFEGMPYVMASARADGNPKSHVAYVEHSATQAQLYVGGLDWGKPGVDVEVCVYAMGTV